MRGIVKAERELKSKASTAAMEDVEDSIPTLIAEGCREGCEARGRNRELQARLGGQ